MRMRTRLLTFSAVALWTASAVLAQGMGPGPGMGRAGGWQGNRVDRLASFLELTDSQKIAAKAIFDDARKALTPLLPAVQQAQQALRDAEKTATSEQQLQTLLTLAAKVTQAMAPIMGIHAQAEAKFYALLTQDQKDKLGKLNGLMRPGAGGGFRRGRR